MSGIHGVALVTGASGGVGYDLADRLARRGYDLILVGEDDQVDVAAAALTVYGGNIDPVQADLGAPEGLHALQQRTLNSEQPISVAVLSLPIDSNVFGDGSLEDTLDSVDRTVQPALTLVRTVLAQLVARRCGRLLLTSSIPSLSEVSRTAYTASTTLLQAFAEVIREEVRSSGVVVVSVLPDFGDDRIRVAKNAFDRLMKDTNDTWATRATLAAVSAAGRLMPDHAKSIFQYVTNSPPQHRFDWRSNYYLATAGGGSIDAGWASHRCRAD